LEGGVSCVRMINTDCVQINDDEYQVKSQKYKHISNEMYLEVWYEMSQKVLYFSVRELCIKVFR